MSRKLAAATQATILALAVGVIGLAAVSSYLDDPARLNDYAQVAIGALFGRMWASAQSAAGKSA